MLVLWDIDGTLLSSEGTGARGIEIAGRELFGAEFSLSGIELGGRLDPLILRDVFAMIGVEDSEAHHANYRARYHDILKEILAGDHPVQALVGAVELLVRLGCAGASLRMCLLYACARFREAAACCQTGGGSFRTVYA